MKSNRRLTYATHLCLLSFLAQQAAGQDEFIRSTIRPKSILEGRVFEDVTGDGLCDVILFNRDTIWVYAQDASHRFPGEPSSAVRFSDHTTVFGFSDLDGNETTDILELAGEKLVARNLMTGKALDVNFITPPGCLFAGLENFPPTHYWFLLDNLIGPYPYEIVLPTERGLFTQEIGGPRKGQALLIPYDVEGHVNIDDGGLEGKLSKIVRVPLLQYVHLDPGLTKEVSISRGRRVDTYRTTFAEGASDRARLEKVCSLTLKPPSGEPVDPWFPAGTNFPEVLGAYKTIDIDADGHPDLYRFDPSRRTLTMVFGRSGDHVAKAPDEVLPLAASPTGIHMQDGNGNGRKDLYLHEEKDVSNPKEAFLALMRGSVDCRLTVFENRGGRKPFRPTPSWIGTYPLRPALGTKNGSFYLGLRLIVRTDIDLNGDERLDLVLQPRDGRLRFHRGIPTRVYEPEAWAEIDIDTDKPYQDITTSVPDLDQDGRDDLVLHYRAWDDSPAEKLVMLVSRLE